MYSKMNVNENRSIDDVIILGSGESILELTNEEVDYINKCKTVIAMNKFMAFYKKSNILPTHVYFHDTHENSIHFLNYIFAVCQGDSLRGVTFILSKEYRKNFFTDKGTYYLSFIVTIKNMFLKYVKNTIKNRFFTTRMMDVSKEKTKVLLPRDFSYEFIATNNWLEGGY